MPQSTATQLAVMQKDVSFIRQAVEGVEKKVASVENKMDGQFVSKIEFEPIKRLVYGMVGLVLTAVIVALLALVIRSTQGL